MNLSHTVVLLAAALAGADNTPEIKVESVVVTLIKQVEVPARERGELVSVTVHEGQIVQLGAELARIDDTEAQLERNRAQIELERTREQAKNTLKIELAKKGLALAQTELDRAKESADRFKRAISDSEIDHLQLEVDKSKLAVENAQHEHELAQFDWRAGEATLELAMRHVERRRILAPLSGVVVQINHHEGEWVEPGETLMRIVQMDRLRVDGFLDAKHLDRDLTGRRIRLNTSLPGQGDVEFSGVLRFVSPEVDPVDGKVRIWAEIANPDFTLRPGLRGTLTVETMTATPENKQAER